MSSKKILLGLLTGLAAGALLGVLFAPWKGSKTRKNIINKGEDYVDHVKEKYNSILGGIADKIEMVKEGVNDFTGKSQTKTKESEN